MAEKDAKAVMGYEKKDNEGKELLQKLMVPLDELSQEYNQVLHQTNMELSGVQKRRRELQSREEALIANKERLEGALGSIEDLKGKLDPESVKRPQG